MPRDKNPSPGDFMPDEGKDAEAAAIRRLLAYEIEQDKKAEEEKDRAGEDEGEKDEGEKPQGKNGEG